MTGWFSYFRKPPYVLYLLGLLNHQLSWFQSFAFFCRVSTVGNKIWKILQTRRPQIQLDAWIFNELGTTYGWINLWGHHDFWVVKIMRFPLKQSVSLRFILETDKLCVCIGTQVWLVLVCAWLQQQPDVLNPENWTANDSSGGIKICTPKSIIWTR